METFTTIEACTVDPLMVAMKVKIYKSPGSDGLHPHVLNELADTISIPLSIIFKTSLTTGMLLTDWKREVVGEILEAIIRDTITQHMNNNDLLSNKQFGFIKGRSTVLQLLKVHDIWTKSMDNGGCIDVIYCDFIKAFDKVPHH